jgi:hypothetical protein
MVEQALMDIRQWTFKERKNYAGIFNGLKFLTQPALQAYQFTFS